MNFLEKACKNKTSNDDMALVVQGGGMRGVYSMSALSALEELGMTNNFKYVAGSSAGAINGAYFIANQAKSGVESYVNELSVSDFVSFFRINKIVDVDFLVDWVVKNTIHLSISGVFNSKTELEMSLTNSKTIQAKYLSTKTDEFDMHEALRATMALPVLYDKEISVLGDTYIDGGISDYVPLQKAIDKGYKKIVVILTSEFKHRHDKFKFIIKLATLGKSKLLTDALLCEDERYNSVIDIIKSSHPDIEIICIAPSDKKRLVGTTTTNQKKLLDCALMAREDVYAAVNTQIPKTENENFFDLWDSRASVLKNR
ncbi:MAG TPA: patatin family protein [Piscirickettsiaceae bacterium]|jgi:predicted patatin/cPLA2 family phospholipase|nr:patatin family protein [Piscirickettsiaceae bacterium]